MKVGFLYEHPTWSDDLRACFAQNGIELVAINVADAAFLTSKSDFDFDLCINRVNMMPSEGRASSVAAHTLHVLHLMESLGIEVINGSQAHFVGASKAVQNGIFESLGLDCPKSVAIYRPEDAPAAAETIGFPVIVKPNIGGSGSGVARFDTAQELRDAIADGSLDLGIDGTGLVQEYIRSDGHVYRVEILDGALFYSIRQQVVENQFNYCAADGCSISFDDGPAADEFDMCVIGNDGIVANDVPAEILQNVLDICAKSKADIGGVEYFLREDSGSACFYDFNPYSNFVGNGEALFGFSPEQRFVDFVKSRMG